MCGRFVQIYLVALLRSRWHSGAMPALPLVEGRRLCSSSTAHFHCSRLYFPVTLARSEQLRLPVHNFITLSPVDPRRKINELGADQFTTLFHHYNWAHRRRNDGKHSPLAVLGDARGKQ